MRPRRTSAPPAEAACASRFLDPSGAQISRSASLCYQPSISCIDAPQLDRQEPGVGLWHEEHCFSCGSRASAFGPPYRQRFVKSSAEPHVSLCSPCSDKYDKEEYCQICHATWDDEDLEMLGCDSCDSWVHSACEGLTDKSFALVQKQEYHCPDCRGTGPGVDLKVDSHDTLSRIATTRPPLLALYFECRAHLTAHSS